MTRVVMLSMHTSPLAQPGFGNSGGMNVYVRELSDALSRRGVEVDIFTGANEAGVDVIDLHSRVRVHHVDLESVRHAGALQRADRFADVVSEHLETTGGADVVHAHYWLSGAAGHRLKHALDVPLVSTFHTLARVKAEWGVPDDSPERESTEAAIIGCSDAVVASSLVEVGDIRRHYDTQTPIEIVAPGIDTMTFTPGDRLLTRAQLSLPVGVPVVVFAGRVQRAKGLDRALHALAQVRMTHPDALLIVIGGPSGSDGEHSLSHARSLIDDFALQDNVRFVGPQSRASLALYLRAADVCVVPSRTESFGLIALEAAASGTPVVASATGGLQFVVQHGQTGFLTRDIDELAGALDHLFSEPSKARQFGAAAAARARTFTWSSSAEQMLGVYRDVINRQRLAPAACLTA